MPNNIFGLDTDRWLKVAEDYEYSRKVAVENGSDGLARHYLRNRDLALKFAQRTDPRATC